MSRVETLIKSRSKESVKFFEFIRFVAKNPDSTTVFFEGEDEKYYSIRLNSIAPELKWHGVNAEGKRNVLGLRSLIRSHPEYKTYSCIFLVDADFDDNTSLADHEDVYVTPCYSVENLYISESTLERILSAEFKITKYGEDAEIFNKAIETYINTKQKYHACIVHFNVWIMAYRKQEQTEPFEKLNINNVKFDQIADITLGDVSKNYDESKIPELFPVNSEPSQHYLDNAAKYFETHDPERHFRGKQQLEFFRIFLEKLKMDANSKSGKKVFSKKMRVVLNLTKANCLSELSNYADTPECLVSFIKSIQATSRSH